jgi:hypothetical protein
MAEQKQTAPVAQTPAVTPPVTSEIKQPNDAKPAVVDNKPPKSEQPFAEFEKYLESHPDPKAREYFVKTLENAQKKVNESRAVAAEFEKLKTAHTTLAQEHEKLQKSLLDQTERKYAEVEKIAKARGIPIPEKGKISIETMDAILAFATDAKKEESKPAKSKYEYLDILTEDLAEAEGRLDTDRPPAHEAKKRKKDPENRLFEIITTAAQVGQK